MVVSEDRKLSIPETICLSAFAGIAARPLCHPLDTMKTVSLANNCVETVSMRAAGVVWRSEGLKGFYRGFGVATAGAMPGVALYLTTYDKTKDYVSEFHPTVPASVNHLGSGFLAEAVSCVVWVPIDVTKERLQSQTSDVAGRYKNSLDAVRTCLRLEGLRGLYKGYFSTLASFGPYSAFYFTFFEMAMQYQYSSVPFVQSMTAAAIGNTMSCILTNPLELVKVRMQVQRCMLDVGGTAQASQQFRYGYTSFANGLVTLVRTEGVRGLLRGVGPRAMYAVPNAAITMAIFDSVKARIAATP
jgi:hypothetical protein